MAKRGGKGGKRTSPDRAAMEGRRRLVAARVLERKSIREIAAELAALPDGPADCSAATVGRDVQALRLEWARARVGMVEQVVGEDLTRLNAVEVVLWPAVLAGSGEAIDRWRAVRQDRERLLGVVRGLGVQVDAPAGGAVRIEVEFVEDWRAALASGWGGEVAAAGQLALPVVGDEAEAGER